MNCKDCVKHIEMLIKENGDEFHKTGDYGCEMAEYELTKALNFIKEG